MRKIYYISINWPEFEAAKAPGDRAEYINSFDRSEGDAIDGLVRDGWRLYAFTTKKKRDDLVHTWIWGNK